MGEIEHLRTEIEKAVGRVTSVDCLTADFFHFEMEFLGRVANGVVNEVRGINRVIDVTSKPPAPSSGSEKRAF